ncbi:GNAT family N-acetyltransferase [soil metagenome]
MPRLVADVVPAGALRDQPQPRLDANGGLTLRPWARTDVDALTAAYSDRSIQQWHHRSMTSDEAARWISDAGARWRAETDAEWAVVASDDTVVGRVALRLIALRIGQAQLSYWTLPEHRGAGVATRATTHLADWALHEVGLWRLEIRHSTRNPASCRVAIAAGFQLEAELGRSHIHADGWHDVHVHTRFAHD